MKTAKDFITSNGTRIPACVVRRCASYLENGMDFQVVMQNELRDLIPVHDEDYAEANEVITEAESLLEYT